MEIAAAEGGDSLKKISIDLYSGGKMRPMGFGTPVVISLAGIKSDKSIPILAHHDPQKIVGHTTSVKTEGKLSVEGVISGNGDAAREVIATAAAGFPWKASLGAAAIERPKFITSDESVQANGQTFDGPLWFYEKTQLVEASVVPIPADRNTAAKVAAHMTQTIHIGGQTMPKGKQAPETTASGTNDTTDPSKQTPEQVAAAAGATPASQAGDTQTPGVNAASADTPTPQTPETITADATETYRKMRADEMEHEKKLRAAANGNEDLVIQAMRENKSIDWVRAEALQAEISAGSPAPAVHTGDTQANGLQVVTAKAQLGLGVPEDQVKARFSDPVLQAATRGSNGIGLVELIHAAMQACGRPIRGHHTSNEFIQAAFTTHEVGQVLGQVVDGVMMAAYGALPPIWEKFCHIGRTENFNPHNRYRLAGSGMGRVNQQGELPSYKLKDAKYTAEVDTDGALISVTRKDVINDNLGALQQIPQMIGRSAYFLIIEAVASLLVDSGGAFFTAGNGNLATGTATALSYESLSAQVAKFMEQKGIDEKILSLEPTKLVVPTALKSVAERLYISDKLISTGGGSSSKKEAANNEHQSKYEPIVIPQIGANGVAGGSDSAWFMFPDPAMAPAIEVAFLRGIRRPTLERAPEQAGVLAMNWNGYIDFGVNYLEPSAARKHTGVNP